MIISKEPIYLTVNGYVNTLYKYRYRCVSVCANYSSSSIVNTSYCNMNFSLIFTSFFLCPDVLVYLTPCEFLCVWYSSKIFLSIDRMIDFGLFSFQTKLKGFYCRRLNRSIIDIISLFDKTKNDTCFVNANENKS